MVTYDEELDCRVYDREKGWKRITLVSGRSSKGKTKDPFCATVVNPCCLRL